MATYVFVGFGAGVGLAFFLALALPILRRRPAPGDDDRGRALKERLAAIERDRASGLIADKDAADAAIDANRAAVSAAPEKSDATARRWRLAAIAFAAVAPAAAAALYLVVGAPALIDPESIETARPAADASAIAAMPEDERRAMIEGMVASLAARLAAAPEDPDGWRMLARSQFVLNRPVDAAGSYRRLLSLEEGTPDDWRNFATALVASMPGGRFPSDAEFLSALDRLASFEAADPMVLFYRGGAARENGDAARAVELWTALLKTVPADAPGRRTLETLIEEARATLP